MTCHRVTIVQFGRRDHNDLVVIRVELCANLGIALLGGRISMNVLAQTIEVDRDTF